MGYMSSSSFLIFDEDLMASPIPWVVCNQHLLLIVDLFVSLKCSQSSLDYCLHVCDASESAS
jgi:hypothetical protein